MWDNQLEKGKLRGWAAGYDGTTARDPTHTGAASRSPSPMKLTQSTNTITKGTGRLIDALPDAWYI